MSQKASLQVSGKTYQVLREIGSGSFGVVYLVQDERGGEFALKVLHIRPTLAQIEAFKDEFRLLTQLKHPYLCAAHDFAYSEELKNYLFVSDYAPGKPFFEATKGRSPEEIERLAVQVLEVLDYLHLHGVIHFDVKCPNILVQADDTIRLLDFGFAHLQINPLTKFPGSFRYAAPEILLRSDSTDGRADLYSLGMVLYRALARRFPFYPENDPFEIMDWHLRRSISWTPEQCRKIPDHLRRLIDHLTKKNPAERLSRARAAINWINLHTEDRYRTAEASLSSSIPLEGSLMGRGEEIKTALKSLEARSGEALVFLGERGIGKSRLLREIKYAAEVQEFRCLWLDHFSEKDGVFQLTQQLDLSSVRSPDEFFQESIAKLQKGAPPALFIDDLQEADPLFSEWLMRVHQEGLLPALFLGWEGPVPSHGPLVPLFQRAKVVPLAPLAREDLKAYIAEVLSGSERGEGWLDSLYEFSSGIPLLVGEGLRYLLEDPGRRRLPPSIERLYGDSLLSLSREALVLLEGLSLWRRAASLEELSRTVSLEIPKIAPLIPHLLSKGLVSAVSFFENRSLHYRVSNAALALVLQERQTQAQREERTKKILASIEAGGKSSLEELAFYASQSGDVAKARDYLFRLGERYEASFHTQKAIQTYQEVLSRFAEGDPDLISRTRKKLIPLLVLAGRPEEALALFPEEAKLDLSDRKLKGWVLTRSGRFPEAESLYQEGIMGSSAEDPLHRDLLNALANVYVQTHQIEKALRLFRQTLPLDSMREEERLKVLKSNNLGLALALSGRFEEALVFEKEKLALFKKQGDEHQVASILSQLGFIELKGQNLLQATLYFEEALALSERLGDLHNILILLDNLIIIFQRRGLYREALSTFSKAVNYRSAVSPVYQRIQNHLKGAFLYLTIGLPEPAKSHLDRIDALLNDVPSPVLKGWTELAWGYYYRAAGLPEEAGRHFEDSIAISCEDKEDSLQAWGHYALADLWFERKKGNEASEEYRKAFEDLPQLADEELRLRMRLLCLLLQRDGFLQEKAAEGPLERLKQLGEECESKGMAEIAAEAYLAAHDRRAKTLYLEIASHLPEEYKIAYESARLRQVEREFFKTPGKRENQWET